MRPYLALAALAGITSCGATMAERTPARSASVEAFVGRWRSTTPSLEFVRLEMSSAAVGQPTISARLTLSGAAFDAAGRIDGDSLVAPMAIVGATQIAGTLVVHALRNGTLSAQMRSAGAAAPQNLTFTRE